MRRAILLCLPALFSLAAPAWATTKGLNQIVTPDVQSFGILSLSASSRTLTSPTVTRSRRNWA